MNKTVDARGLGCPKPVIMTKKAIDEVVSGRIDIIIDNAIAKENVIKLVKKQKLEYSVDEKNNEYIVSIVKEGSFNEKDDAQKNSNIQENLVVSISNDVMGQGERELGEILIKGFIYTLTESLPFPSAVIFFNNGVRLTCEGSKSIEDLKILENAGVSILSCGTCLDYYGLKDKLKVGGVSNMYTIVDTLKNADRIINI